uniref:Uncharacterized protein n=1 Tax=Tanacetum cinerariifolium TaxID=118510 RepID=A0A6L2LJZ1_TANCI|nr:hypothetical protein [Tanacetum cinerariifolium]
MYIDHYKQLQPKLQQQQLIHHHLNHSKSTIDSILIKHIDELKQIMANLIQEKKHLKERKKKGRHDSPKTPPGALPHQPPPPPPPPAAPISSKTAALAEYITWMTSDTRFKPSVSSILEDLHMNDDSALDEQVNSFDDEDIGNDHIPKTDDMATFMDSYCKHQGINELKQEDLEGPAFEIIKFFHHNVIHLKYQMEECHKLLTDKVDNALIRPALSISKMKAAYYPDVGLEKMVPGQIWIEEECKDKYGVQMIMMFNEIHKFSDGTLNQIDEALDYRVKEFMVNGMNSGLNPSEDGNPARANIKQALGSDDERTESDSDDIPDPNLIKDDQTKYEEEVVDEGVRTPSDDEFTDEEKLDDEYTKDDKEDDEVIKELYDDVNVNLGNNDTEMTDDDQGGSQQINVSKESRFAQEKKTPINLSSTYYYNSRTHICLTSTTHPPPSFFNPFLQQQTPTIPTPTFINPIVTLPEIPNFASVFKFDQRYLAFKMKEEVNVAIQLQTNKLKEKAQIKNFRLPQSASLLEFKLKKIHIDKMEANKSTDGSNNQKNLYNALVKSYNSDEDILTLYGNVVLLKKGRDDQDKDEGPSTGSNRGTKRRKSEELSHTVKELGMQQDQEFVTGDNVEKSIDKEVTKADWFKKSKRLPTPDPD